jgi:L-rhamnose mutarotase
MRLVMTTDLGGSQEQIDEYEHYHDHIWPEVVSSLKVIGIRALDIYRLERRLIMIMEVPDGFDKVEAFARHRISHPRCGEWEVLMSGYQAAPAGAAAGEKWGEMKKIFSL